MKPLMLANRDWQRGCRSDLTEAIKSDTVRTWESKVDVVSNAESRQPIGLAAFYLVAGVGFEPTTFRL